jgi:hypothetical protein
MPENCETSRLPPFVCCAVRSSSFKTRWPRCRARTAPRVTEGTCTCLIWDKPGRQVPPTWGSGTPCCREWRTRQASSAGSPQQIVTRGDRGPTLGGLCTLGWAEGLGRLQMRPAVGGSSPLAGRHFVARRGNGPSHRAQGWASCRDQYCEVGNAAPFRPSFITSMSSQGVSNSNGMAVSSAACTGLETACSTGGATSR